MITAHYRGLNIGLKLWSTNTHLANRADQLFQEGWIDYLELYVVPQTIHSTLRFWRSLEVPFMLHCPHAAHGFNLAQAELFALNAKKFIEVQYFADELRADVIVTHGGNGGTVKETIRQLKHLDDRRIFLENKPRQSLIDSICIGHSPEEVSKIVVSANLAGFILDFGHAIYAANSSEVDTGDYIDEFLKMKPTIFHIGDGDRTSERDIHLNLGEGTFEIDRLVSLVPPRSYVAIETPTDMKLNLVDFVENVRYLRRILEQQLPLDN